MSNIENGIGGGVPSRAKLLRSAAIASVVASFVLIAVVFPAEYGIDVTGIGRLISLTPMGRIKETLSQSARSSAVALSNRAYDGAKTDLIEVKILPNQRRQLGIRLGKGASVSYAWSSEVGNVHYEIRAGAGQLVTDSAHRYRTGLARSDEGLLVARFDDIHVWSWRNPTDKLVTVTIRINGDNERCASA